MSGQPKVVWQVVDPRDYQVFLMDSAQGHILERHVEFVSSIDLLQNIIIDPHFILQIGDDYDTHVYCQLGFIPKWSKLWAKVAVKFDATFTGEVVTAHLDNSISEGKRIWSRKKLRP